jgi:hypothetical protein
MALALQTAEGADIGASESSSRPALLARLFRLQELSPELGAAIRPAGMPSGKTSRLVR